MKIKHILFFVSLVILFGSCSKDTDPVLPTYRASILTHPENQTLYELKQDDAAKEVFALSWIADTQDQLAVGPASYYVQVDLAERNFAAPVVLTQTDATADDNQYSVSINVKDLNNVLIENLGLNPDSVANIQFRVITHIGNTLLASTASNIFEAQVIPYELSREALFFVGNMFGEKDWDNSNYKFILFRSTPDALDTYTGKFIAGSEFKFITEKNLETWNAYGAGATGKLSPTGDNIAGITTAGYYTVTADLATLSYSIEPYDASKAAVYKSIGLIGDFNSWSADVVLTQASYNPHIWFADDVVLSEGGVKFRADADWASSWGGDFFPYGGGSGENISVKAGKYYIVFNDLTGQYVFLTK